MKIKMKKDLLYLYLSMSSLGVLIIIYFLVMKYLFKKNASAFDPLNKKIINIHIFGKTCCSSWPISHFVSYAIFTYIWPQYIIHIFVLGIVWECVEYLFKLLTTPKGKELKFKRTRNKNNDIEYTTWWDSSSKDIIFNSMGIAFGYGLKKFIM